MNISKISSSFGVNPKFNGIFREVSSNKHIDNEQRYEFIKIHSVYHPNKNESEKDIAKAMRAYTRVESYSSGNIPDGGIGATGNLSYTQGWSGDTSYTCERGERLPY